jgi:beta-aspartyl-peptidase (threonine type)
VVVHGGAGSVSEAKRHAHVEGCKRGARAGMAALEKGATALEGAIEAVAQLENDELFNAGTGASLTAEATLELDASVMEGTTKRGGAVALLPPFGHPVRVARAVLEDGRHVFYAGPEAAAFAREAGFAPSSLEAMRTEAAVERLERFRRGQVGEGWAGGTVGAVVIDGRGRTAAATSTGGTVGKRPGRIGDTPVLGAGTYADDEAGACSATGIGETILRGCLAHEATVLLRHGVPARQAAESAIAAFGRRVEGEGGLIVVDRTGAVGLAWNTETMSHAVARAGEPVWGGC